MPHMPHKNETPITRSTDIANYNSILSDVTNLLKSARRYSAKAVNTLLTATYWLIGKRIVEFEQGGEKRAAYGEELLKRLSQDLTGRFGRGFSERNLEQMRSFYLSRPISQTPSAKSKKDQTPSGQFDVGAISNKFSLSWSHYVRLLSIAEPKVREFYETEALRCGWSVRQLDRQISTNFYERLLLSKNKMAILKKCEKTATGDMLSPEEEIRDPYVLEFLNLKDEYSESDLEQALIQNLETFLLELGGDFAFIGRQHRLRIGNEWYRVDLLFFHRKLRCLVIIDLKIGKFTHADAGQMHLYLNYAREHWMRESENPPVGLILCAQKDNAVAKYALEGLQNKVLAAEYKMTLPDEKLLTAELERTRKILESRLINKPKRQ